MRPSPGVRLLLARNQTLARDGPSATPAGHHRGLTRCAPYPATADGRSTRSAPRRTLRRSSPCARTGTRGPPLRARISAQSQRSRAPNPQVNDLRKRPRPRRGPRQVQCSATSNVRRAPAGHPLFHGYPRPGLHRRLTSRRTLLPKGEKALRLDWHAAYPGLPMLAERCSELSEEVGRWRALLREHGIEAADESARTAVPPPAEPASDGRTCGSGPAPVEAGSVPSADSGSRGRTWPSAAYILSVYSC